MAADMMTSRVLVIDDEKDIREGCQRILSRMGCDVLTAVDGETGVAEFENHKPEIVLSDLKMPGIDGIEVLRRIRDIDSSVLVIIITGYATIDTAIEAMKQGAYDFIAKPFEPDQLRIVVGRAVEKLNLRRHSEALERERLKNLADLGAEKSRIHTIIDSLPNGIVVTNSLGNVVLMNPVFKQNFEIPDTIESGQQVEHYIPDDGLCKLIHEVSKGLHRQENGVPTYELTLQNEEYLLARGQSVYGEDNEPLGAVMIFTNITDLKNFDQLKSEFVAKVSHELRSPLTTIHEQLAVVLDEMSFNDDENRLLLSRAKEKTRMLISMIGNLLDLSRIESGNEYNDPRLVNVGDILDKTVEFLRSRAETKKQALLIEHEIRDMPYVTADPLALESIFGNLITNAIKYTPKGGRIEVRTKVTGKTIVVTVQDNGYGMDGHHRDMVFEKFYRVKTDKTRHIVGTGLGLSIVKGLVDAMEGGITVDSEPDQGSTFTVSLPVK